MQFWKRPVEITPLHGPIHPKHNKSDACTSCVCTLYFAKILEEKFTNKIIFPRSFVLLHSRLTRLLLMCGFLPSATTPLMVQLLCFSLILYQIRQFFWNMAAVSNVVKSTEYVKSFIFIPTEHFICPWRGLRLNSSPNFSFSHLLPSVEFLLLHFFSASIKCLR
jgi:hypothetical protein